MNEEIGEPVVIPIDGELDLHTFRPREVKTLVPDYLEQCLEQGIEEVRIIHGKGTGQLREAVHSALRKSPMVASFGLDPGPSGWGCTVVTLKGGRKEAGE